MMTALLMDPRWKATLAAAVLFGLGAVTGLALDRLWRGAAPPAAEAAPLTVEAMADALELEPGDRARVEALLDSLRVEVTQAARQSPESLQVVARRARQRLEAVLPPDRRGPFQDWMRGHHQRMMDHMRHGGMMGGGPTTGPSMGPSMMDRNSGHGGSERHERHGGHMGDSTPGSRRN